MAKPKILVIVGPTASGKSDLAVSLARRFDGEVISADSRQVYEGMDIGTGKITKKEMLGVPHHLLDAVSPKKTFSSEDWKKAAENAIEDILSRGKLPIVCGGTGFYISNLVDNVILPDVPLNPKLRTKLRKFSTEALFKKLQMLDPRRAASIDRDNPHRLIRAIEIATSLGAVPEAKADPKYDALQIGIMTDDATLKERIRKRLVARMKKGMVAEAKRLHERGVSWKRMEELGLEYRYLARLIQKKISKAEFMTELEREICRYAKRQKTWWKRDARIKWFPLADARSIERTVREFLG